jgi:hypothetical protein
VISTFGDHFKARRSEFENRSIVQGHLSLIGKSKILRSNPTRTMLAIQTDWDRGFSFSSGLTRSAD